MGFFWDLSIKKNITLPAILKRISRYGIVDKTREKEIVSKHGNSLSIKTPNYEQKVKNLSGGNQQKVVLSKWLARESHVLILDEPTRGIDVGAKQEIYNLINQLSEKRIGHHPDYLGNGRDYRQCPTGSMCYPRG